MAAKNRTGTSIRSDCSSLPQTARCQPSSTIHADLPSGGPWDQVTAEAARTGFVGMASYYGSYSLDTQAGTVSHWVESAMAPDMIGGTQVRGYRFLSPDRIELSVVSNSEGLSNTAGDVLVWERVHRQQQRSAS